MTAAGPPTTQPPPDVYHISPAPTAAVGRYKPVMSGELIILRHYP